MTLNGHKNIIISSILLFLECLTLHYESPQSGITQNYADACEIDVLCLGLHMENFRRFLVYSASFRFCFLFKVVSLPFQTG